MTTQLPSRHDGVTMTCPVCGDPFAPNGRRRFCTDACRAAAYRRRRNTATPPVTVPAAQPRRPITVYECGDCGTRTLGEQRCDDCSTFMTRVGIGGACPCCDEPITVAELVDQEVTTTI
jgi:predicted nucleic acid-binding Zn ribbon protein